MFLATISHRNRTFRADKDGTIQFVGHQQEEGFGKAQKVPTKN